MGKPVKSLHLPPTVFVVRRTDADEPYLIADTELDAFDGGEIVGTYVLSGVATKVVRHELAAAGLARKSKGARRG